MLLGLFPDNKKRIAILTGLQGKELTRLHSTTIRGYASDFIHAPLVCLITLINILIHPYTVDEYNEFCVKYVSFRLEINNE